MEGFECRTPLLVPSLVEQAGPRPLQTVDFSFQNGVPGDLPPPTQPVFRRISSWRLAVIGGRGSSRGRHFGVDAARGFRTAPEKFSTHVSIAVPLCNSGSNRIWSYTWIWKSTQSMRLKWGRSGGCWKNDRHAVSMSTGRWSELSAEQEVRYTWKGRSFAITMSKT